MREIKTCNGNKECLQWLHLLDIEKRISAFKDSSIETSRIQIQREKKSEKTREHSRTMKQYQKGYYV